MGKVTERSSLWEFVNSLYIVAAFFYPFTFIAFLIIGRKARCKKWMAVSVFYFIFIIVPLISISRIGISFIIYIVGVIHAFLVRKEYLIRLEVLIQNNTEKEENQKLKENITKEYHSKTSEHSVKTRVEPSVKPPENTASPLSQPKQKLSVNEDLRKIHEISMSVADETIKNCMKEIVVVAIKVFEQVEEQPEKESSIKTFTNYYLPETLKICQAYQELSNHSMKSANMINSITEIEGMLSTILVAFKNQYNELFDDRVFEISTDIKVLKDIFSQDGLTGENENVFKTMVEKNRE